MDDNEISNLAYSLWEQAGRPDGRSEHFWQLARDRLDKASIQHDSDDPTIWEFDKRIRNSEHPISFRGDVWRIQGLFAQAAEKALGVVPAAPEILWHYTTGSNVASIIQSGEIWSTRLDCLNDSSEYQLAFKLLSEVLSFRPLSTSSENERSFHTYLSRRFSERPRYFEDCFISCFSEERNDLSQWRAYGGPQGENGFAIGFDAHALIKSTLHLSLPPHLSLQRVEYSDQCLRQYLSIIIEGLFSFYLEGSAWDENRHSLRRAWEDITYTCFERAAICRFPSFKDEAFKAENEWRLITWMDGRSTGTFKFTQGGSMLRQHLPIPASRMGYNEKLLPIREIVVGPSQHALTSKTTIENLLLSNGYNLDTLGWHPQVSTSNIPLQTT